MVASSLSRSPCAGAGAGALCVCACWLRAKLAPSSCAFWIGLDLGGLRQRCGCDAVAGVAVALGSVLSLDLQHRSQEAFNWPLSYTT